MSAAEFCHGCGVKLPPPSKYNHRQKWCSERCRKASHGDPCVDCGARTIFGAEHKRVPEPRCRSCSTARRVALRKRQVEQMWADGLSARAIGETLGWDAKNPGCVIAGLRSRGYNLPYRNPGSARYGAVHGSTRLALARAARAVA